MNVEILPASTPAAGIRGAIHPDLFRWLASLAKDVLRKPTHRTVTASTTASVGELIFVDTTDNDVTVTLPSGATVNDRVGLKITDDTNDVFVVPPAGQSLDSAGSATYAGGGGLLFREFLSDGSNWWVV